MKTKTITTPSCTLLVCELPEGYDTIKIFGKEFLLENSYGDAWYVSTPKGNWQLINRLPEVTEEQAIEIVESIHLTIMGTWYKSYKDHTWTCELATTSLRTLLESEGVCFENPLGDEPTKEHFGFHESNSFDDQSGWLYEGGEDRYYEVLQDWQAAQEQVWDRNLCYLFKQVK